VVSDAGNLSLLKKLAQLEAVIVDGASPDEAFSILAGKHTYLLDLPVDLDPEAEREKLTKEADYLRGFIASVEKKLGNERFVTAAPQEVVDRERKKLEDGRTKLNAVEEAISKL
jgi:valyl-tRNA synthetase